MEADQNLLDAQVNRKSRSIVEKIAVTNAIASIISFVALSYIYRNYNLISDNFLNFISFYPERILIGNETVYAKIAIASSNIFCMSYTLMHLIFIKPEIIRDKYQRQDRKQLLLIISGFFYLLRFLMLYLFSSEGGVPLAMISFPSLSIVVISTMLIGFTTNSGENQKP